MPRFVTSVRLIRRLTQYAIDGIVDALYRCMIRTMQGRDGIELRLNGAQLTIVREGSERTETWSNPADMVARLKSLMIPVVDTGTCSEIPYWRAA